MALIFLMVEFWGFAPTHFHTRKTIIRTRLVWESVLYSQNLAEV